MVENQRDYYLKTEIAPLLESTGKPRSTFYTLAREGKIKTFLLESEKVYDKPTVDAFLEGTLVTDGRRKRETQSGLDHNPVSSVMQEPTADIIRHHDDLGDAYTIESGLLGWDQAIFPHIIKDWQYRNDHGYWLLRNNNKEIWAVLGILPLSEETIYQLLKGDLLPRDIKPDDVLPYRAGQEYDCYITSAATIPEQPSSIIPLMQHVLSYWCKSSGVYIKRIYAVSDVTIEDTPILRLASEYSFSMISEFSQDNRVAWVLRSDLYNRSIIVQEFQDCQRQKKEEVSMLAMQVLEEVTSDEKQKRAKNLPKIRHANAEGYFTASSRFRLAEVEDDIREIVRINRALFGAASSLNENQAVQLLSSWWKQNKEVFQVLEVDGEIVGYVSLLPLPARMVDNIMSDAMGVSKIRPEDIQAYEPGHPVDIYVWTVGLHPDYQRDLQEKRTLGRYLLQGIINMFHDFGERGIEVRSVWARSDTDDGIGISQGLGFSPVIPTPSKSGKNVFLLDIAWSNRPFLVTYMRALMDYRGKHTVVKSEA